MPHDVINLPQKYHFHASTVFITEKGENTERGPKSRKVTRHGGKGKKSLTVVSPGIESLLTIRKVVVFDSTVEITNPDCVTN